ncbi:pyruvate kinase, partial [Candidatus Deferrimicrobium sp.]|uniref:pyruvate kinase n=1 Tax=Candidatus Deferrimicrobium sp. TaxID=3060586 RepID=UPI003C54DAF4
GMNVARLNFSHGVFEDHRRVMENLRGASRRTGRRLAIMADLPGPKIRIGLLATEPVQLHPGDPFTLTTEPIVGDATRASVDFPRLPASVRKGDTLYLNDGIIRLEVEEVRGNDMACRVMTGGELRSRKGLNVPGVDLGIGAFTARDQECLKFALESGVDAVSQSFVASAEDIHEVRRAARAAGRNPFLIAKIERAIALEHIDGILGASDGIMVARGDLGVEIPIERIAIEQKRLVRRANLLGKPVITATQMLESMTGNARPTRAEATDVANAVIDGTDCVMLSGESAVGRYPVEAVRTLARIAVAAEPYRAGQFVREAVKTVIDSGTVGPSDLVSMSIENVLARMSVAAVVVPSRSGATARQLTRLRLPVWITAASTSEETCQGLQFSYGVYPEKLDDAPGDWRLWAKQWVAAQVVPGNYLILIEGPSPDHPDVTQRLEVIDLRS